eukprot:9261661-Heterocapsa_arctica.AAC.1
MFRDALAQHGRAPDIVLNFAQEGQNVLNAMYLESVVPRMTLGWQSSTLENWAVAQDADGGAGLTA